MLNQFVQCVVGKLYLGTWFPLNKLLENDVLSTCRGRRRVAWQSGNSVTRSVALETYNKCTLHACHAHHSQRQHKSGRGDDIQFAERAWKLCSLSRRLTVLSSLSVRNSNMVYADALSFSEVSIVQVPNSGLTRWRQIRSASLRTRIIESFLSASSMLWFLPLYDYAK